MAPTEIKRDLFEEWGKSVRVRKIQESLDALTAKAKENGRLLEEEMKAQNFKSFDKFARSCPRFDLTCWPEELAELGGGFVLYFHFLAFMAVALVFVFFLHIPMLASYNVENNWIVGWHWHDWTRSWSQSECTCLGLNNGVTGPLDSGSLSHASYGTECNAWDTDFCQSSPGSFSELGKWCCVSWCFASSSCLAPPNTEEAWMSNIHYSGMVRATTACSQDSQSLVQCPNQANVAFNEAGVESVAASQFLGSYWLTLGNYGPDQADKVLIPWLYLACVAFLAVVILGMHQFQRMTDSKVDAALVQPNDFAALVKGLPATATDEKSIMSFFQDHALSKRRVEIVKVVIGWDASGFREQIATIRRLVEEDKQLKLSDPRKREIQKEILQVKRNLASISPDAASRLASSGTVVVIFRYQQDLRECVERWNSFWAKWCYCDFDSYDYLPCFPGLKKGPKLPFFPIGDPPNYIHKLTITRAPNPGDINWEQFDSASFKNIEALMRTTGLTFLLLTISFFLIWGTTKLQDTLNEDNSDLAGGASVLTALVVSFNNASLMRLFRFFGERKEFHDSHTQKEFSIAIKMVFGLLVNTAAVVLFLNAKPSEWYVRGGLVENMFFVLLIDAFVPPAFFFVDLKYRFKWLRRRKLTDEKLAKWNEIMRTTGGVPKSPEAEKEVKGVTAEIERFKTFFEPTEMDNPRRYANAMSTFLCTLFFSPVFPLGLVIGIGGLTWQYCIDKYLLLRWYKRPTRPYDTQLAKWSLKFLKVAAPLGLTLSFFFFLSPSWKEKGDVLTPFLMSLLVSLVVSIVPSTVLRTLLGMRLVMGREGFSVYEEGEDYYKAQHHWSPTMKYHKSHFLYKKLPESKNPEFLSPSVDTTVKIDDVKSTYGSATAKAAEEAGDERPVMSFRGGVEIKHLAESTDDMISMTVDSGSEPEAKASRYGARLDSESEAEKGKSRYGARGSLPTSPDRKSQSEGRAPSRYGTASALPTAPVIASPVAPVLASPSTVGHEHARSDIPTEESVGEVRHLDIVWEFERSQGRFCALAADCQTFVESRYQEYQNGSGGPQIRRLKTAGHVVSINFEQMTSQVVEPPSKIISTLRRSERPRHE